MADLKMESNPKFRKHGLPDSIKFGQLQNLLHESLMSTNHVQKCAIVSRKDASIVATSVGFKLHSDQAQMLLESFTSPHHTREHGIFYSDTKYNCVRADAHSVYAKADASGLILVLTSTLMLVALYGDNMYPSVCVEAVEKLADYFKEKSK